MQLEEVKNIIRSEGKLLNRILERIDDENRWDDTYSTNWKIGDVLRHILWYEEEMVDLLDQKSMEMTHPVWNNPTDKRNTLIYEQMQEVPISETVDRHHQAYEQILESLDNYTDNDMVDAQNFDGMPSEWKPWQILGGSTFNHYKHHRLQLENIIDTE